MSISFSHYPANWRLPLVGIEVDASQAGAATLRQPAILFGISLGAATPNVPIAVASRAQAVLLFGQGSMLERMVTAFLANNAAALLWCMPIAQPSGGVAATGQISIATPATGAGTLSEYIAGQKVAIAVAAGEANTVTAANLVTAINALTTLPVTAAQGTSTDANKVNLTARWKGLTGNDITLRDNYFGTIGGETLPAGLTLAYTAMAGGSGAPDVSGAIASMGDDLYDYVAFPFTDSTALNLIETEYGFTDSGRWGWARQLYGTVFSAKRDTYANLMTWGATGNSPVSSVMAVEPTMPSPVWEVAAVYTAQAARALLDDPARPLQTLEMTGILPAPKQDRFIRSQRNNLASTGMATQTQSGDGVPMIEVEASRYQLNLYGQPDGAYFVVTTLHTLAAVFRRLTSAITTKYPRSKLANDGTRFGAGQAIVTPKTIKAELVAEYRGMEEDGLVENGDAFKANLIVQRNSTNFNRLDVLFPPDLVNGLRQFAVLAQFRLQYDTTNGISSAA